MDDTGQIIRRQIKDLVKMSTELALHRELDNHKPTTFLTEFQKLVFTVIFNLDKSISISHIVASLCTIVIMLSFPSILKRVKLQKWILG